MAEVREGTLFPTAKVCRRCGESKPESEFYNYTATTGRIRRMARCKSCHSAAVIESAARNPEGKRLRDERYKKSPRHRRRRRVRLYGLDDVELQALEVIQGGHCLICRGYFGENYHVDHDHTTGKVRGLLCNLCNVGLGAFHDDPIRLLRAARYLGVMHDGVFADEDRARPC